MQRFFVSWNLGCIPCKQSDCIGILRKLRESTRVDIYPALKWINMMLFDINTFLVGSSLCNHVNVTFFLVRCSSYLLMMLP